MSAPTIESVHVEDITDERHKDVGEDERGDSRNSFRPISREQDDDSDHSDDEAHEKEEEEEGEEERLSDVSSETETPPDEITLSN